MSLSLFINNNPATNKQVSDTGNQVTVFLNPPIVLDDNKSYHMRLLDSSIVYSMPNVTSKNNTLLCTMMGMSITRSHSIMEYMVFRI